MLATVLLLGLVLVAALTDARQHMIYNWNTYPGILGGIGLSALGSFLAAHGIVDESQLKSLGWIPFEESLFGLLACGLPMLACFVLFGVSGGDVKLIAMLGAFLGTQEGLAAMLWTFVLGGCLGLIVLIWRVGPWRLFVRLLRQLLWTLRLGFWSPLTPEERAELQQPLFLAPCALAAVLIVRFSLLDYLPI
jgi:prepilin peptidase CpaA